MRYLSKESRYKETVGRTDYNVSGAVGFVGQLQVCTTGEQPQETVY